MDQTFRIVELPDILYANMVPISHLSIKPKVIDEFPLPAASFDDETELEVLQLEEKLKETYNAVFEVIKETTDETLAYYLRHDDILVEYKIEMNMPWALDLYETEYEPIPNRCRIRHDKLYVSHFRIVQTPMDQPKAMNVFEHILAGNAVQQYVNTDPQYRAWLSVHKEETHTSIAGADLFAKWSIIPDTIAKYDQSLQGFRQVQSKEKMLEILQEE